MRINAPPAGWLEVQLTKAPSTESWPMSYTGSTAQRCARCDSHPMSGAWRRERSTKASEGNVMSGVSAWQTGSPGVPRTRRPPDGPHSPIRPILAGGPLRRMTS